MNQSDDDIFGRNIDQLDRETPRYNLSEEEAPEEDNEDNLTDRTPPKKKSIEKKPPSIASVQPFTQPQIIPVMSPHPIKKGMGSTDEITNHQMPVGQYYKPRYPMNTPTVYTAMQNMKNFQPSPLSKPHIESNTPLQPPSTQVPPSSQQIHPVMVTMSRQGLEHLSMTNMKRPSGDHPSPAMRPHMPHQIHGDKPTQHIQTPFINQLMNNQPRMHAQLVQDQRIPCYCQDCMHPPQTGGMSQQMVINSERQKIEDEILLRQRELDSCWQEDEVDFPRDFTAIDRKKENFYAQRNDSGNYSRGSSEPVNTEKDILKGRETKTSAVPTSAFPTAVPRCLHQTPSGGSYGPIMKTKAKAVVSPFPRAVPPKKVNFGDTCQDYAANGWPQSEMGSRIPSSERISLSPLCMSAVPSGVQTPNDPDSNQKPLHQQQIGNMVPEVPNSVPSGMPLQQLPGSEKKKLSVLEKFKGNDQYHQRGHFVQPASHSTDSVKDFTTSRWPNSEMGSRIPSSERISLSPLTMSAVPSGIQTPVEPSPACVESRADNQGNTTSKPVEKKTSVPIIPEGHHVETPDPPPEQDAIQDYSQFPQSELSSRIPSYERICLSPLCQSSAPSGRQSPVQQDEDHSADNIVTLRPKKKNLKNDKLKDIVARMNINEGNVPRFNYVEEYSAQNYARPEETSRMQSYENLVFTPSWSANTSGLVTPCDHSSLHGGAKPLRQIPVVEDDENVPSQGGPMNELQKQVDVTETQPTHIEGRKDESSRFKAYSPRSSGESKAAMPTAVVASMAASHNLENDQLPRDTYPNAEVPSSTDMYNNPAEVTNQPIHKQHHPVQNNSLRRRSSWSSGASTASNRTDISTVVNASTSMHNTAPGSPDPDRSEDSDSVASDNGIDDNVPDFPNSFSRSGSPPPPQSRSQSLPLPAPQRRWGPQNAVQGPRLAPRRVGLSGRPENDMSDLKPVSKETKNLIQRAKELFPKQPVTQPGASDFSHPDHMRVHNAHHMVPPSHQPPYQFGYHFHHPQHIDHLNQPRYGNYRPNYDYDCDYDYTATRGHPHETVRTVPYYNYPHRPMQPTHEMQQRYHEPQPRYHANNNIHHRMLAQPHPAHQPRMHPIPERDLVSPGLHNPQWTGLPSDIHSDIHEADVYHGGQAHPAQFQRQLTNTISADPTHIHGYYDSTIPSHEQNRLQSPHQNQQSVPSQQPPHQQTTPQSQAAPNTVYSQRTFSVTSLEPNRASPPPNESLDTASVVSFASMAASNQNLDAKTDMMSSLLSMLGTHDADDMARTLLAMSNGVDNVSAMRQSGCVPLLIQLMHSEDYESDGINWGVRQRAGMALHNIVHSNSGDRRGKREVRVLRLLEIIRSHSEAILSEDDENYRLNRSAPPLREHGPGPAVAAVMKLSFQEDHKNTICELGGLQAVGEILAVDYMANKDCHDPYAIALRKYAGMVLINLTYNDAKNKTVLCLMTNTLKAIIGQLQLTDEEDLVQVFAGIIRNISWRPDDNTQRALKTINAVRALMLCIQKLRTEVCIRAVLSAIWNLSAHNSENKEEICRTPGSLQFLAFALSYRSPSRSIIVAENAGGILRNISSHIAVSGEYRKILRQEGCLQTLVSQLRSPSTRVVSNSCGVLWNLSARCVEDQELLWDLGAVSVLKTLIHSKHKSISASSAAALRNLLAVKPGSGTDTESHVSFQHLRSNSLPTRTRQNRHEKKGRSPVASRKQRHDVKADGPVESNMVYFDNYMDLPPRPVAAEHVIPSVSEDCPPTYNEATSAEPTRRVYTEDGRHHSSENIQHQSDRYFFLGDSSRLPISTRIHKRFDSSSSCSSFSPNESKPNKLPYVNVKAVVNELSEPKSEMEEKFAKLDINPSEDSEEKKTTSLERTTTKEEKMPKEEKKVSRDEKSPRNQVEMKPYEDSRLSVVKDAVMIYVGTPKLPTKPKKEKKQKQLTPKLSTKLKRNAHKKSKDSVCSKDSLNDKTDVEKTNDREKSRGDDKKENIWIKTKEFKQNLLNKSHSSDLAFDKNLMYASTKKSPFDIYSMSNFPDRVASDQCLTMSDRRYRDAMPNFHHAHHHHGSFSSCESHVNDDKMFPANQRVGNVSQSRDINFCNNGNQNIVQPFYSPQIGHEYHNTQRNFFQPNRAYHSNQNMYSTTMQGGMSGDSHIEFASENEKKSKTKKSLLKNPLRKSSDSKFSLKGKKTDKKGKKKSEEKD